jgi:enoyl-CoA hydratase
MHHETTHLRITANRGVATLQLGFPGDPVNALDAARLRELDDAFAVLEANAFLSRVVIRSAKPAGFCAGLSPQARAALSHPADRAAFSSLGQRVFARLAALRAVTVAFIEGPCLGLGLELALACDYRLSVASLTNHLGFPFERPCAGGTARLPKRIARLLIDSGRTLSGREAQAVGLVDRAFCERRAKLELQTVLNELDRHPHKPRRAQATGLAAERIAFAKDIGRESIAIPPLELEIARARGFLTPLEFDQMTSLESRHDTGSHLLKQAA